VPGIIEPDFSESVKLLSRSQELGFLDAQGNLGVLYICGQGVPKDESKAFALFQDGAEKGNPLCMFFYAMLRRGRRSGKGSESGSHLVCPRRTGRQSHGH
jgi:TPR repeat protein